MWKILYWESCYMQLHKLKVFSKYYEITCDEAIVIQQTKKAVLANFNEKKQAAKHKISIFYLHFYKLLQHL